MKPSVACHADECYQLLGGFLRQYVMISLNHWNRFFSIPPLLFVWLFFCFFFGGTGFLPREGIDACREWTSLSVAQYLVILKRSIHTCLSCKTVGLSSADYRHYDVIITTVGLSSANYRHDDVIITTVGLSSASYQHDDVMITTVGLLSARLIGKIQSAEDI